MRMLDPAALQARLYDLAVAPLERAVMGPARAWLAPRARGSVLVVALGTGADLAHLPRGLHITGVDLGPAMLDRARARARRLGRPEGDGLTLLVGDALRLPVADASFDTVLCTFALCEVEDVRTALIEFLRVLRPGGELLLADHVVATAAPVRWIQRGLEAVTGRYGEHWLRRPLVVLRDLDAAVVATRRVAFGAVESVHARKR